MTPGVTAALSIVFGVLIGFSLGLTGGGGSIFAVPLLVYGLRIDPRVAVGASLAAVGGTTLYGLLHRWRDGDIDLRAGLAFSLAGMAGAPAGALLGRSVSADVLLGLFASLMVVVGLRMAWTAARSPQDARVVRAGDTVHERGAAPFRVRPRLVAAGVGAGMLSGFFGIGGGFVMVPSLVLFAGLGIHRAVATSLLAITLVSGAGLATQLVAGAAIPWGTTALFVLGGVAGMALGTRVGRRLSGPRLQLVFAAAILLLAIYVGLRGAP